jgi:hypothetical protein
VKVALVEPAVTVTEAGTVNALVLLESVTRVWLVVAALRYTEHESVVGPVNVCDPHVTLLNVDAEVGAVVGDRVIASTCDIPSAVAVNVAFAAVVTADAVALKAALVDPAGTVTEAGTFNALLLLESVTTVWLVAAALKYTEHESVVGPVNVCVEHDTLLNVETGVVSGDSVIAAICDTLLAVAVSVAFTAVVTADAVALKAALVEPAAIVTEVGTVNALLLLESVTTVWLVAAALRYTEHESVVSPVSVCVAHETLLNVATGAGVGAAAGDSVIASICDTPSAVAVNVAFAAVVTADAVALKAALVEPAATVTEAGTANALALLESVTTVWLVTAALRYTEHESVAGPVNACVAHETLLNVATGAGVGPGVGVGDATG